MQLIIRDLIYRSPLKENTGVNIQRSESSTTTVSLITLDILCKFYGTSLKEFFNTLDIE